MDAPPKDKERKARRAAKRSSADCAQPHATVEHRRIRMWEKTRDYRIEERLRCRLGCKQKARSSRSHKLRRYWDDHRHKEKVEEEGGADEELDGSQ